MEPSSPDKIMFPQPGYTKADLVGYYDRVSHKMAPMLVHRPLTLHRFPGGLGEGGRGKGFMQKNVGRHFPTSIIRHRVPKRDGGFTTYPIITEPDHIPWLANQGTIAFHIWPHQVHPETEGRPEPAPGSAATGVDRPGSSPTAGRSGLSAVHRVAQAAAEVLDRFDLTAVPVVTGSKGIHLWVPVAASTPQHDLVTANRALAGLVAELVPNVATTEFLKRERKGRVFVDWLRANPGATVVAPLSIRATPGASVAVAVSWDELADTAPDRWTLGDVDELLQRPSLLDLAGPEVHRVPVADIAAAARAAGVDLDTPFDRFGRTGR